MPHVVDICKDGDTPRPDLSLYCLGGYMETGGTLIPAGLQSPSVLHSPLTLPRPLYHGIPSSLLRRDDL